MVPNEFHNLINDGWHQPWHLKTNTMEHGLCHQLMRIFASRVKLVRDGFNIDAFLKEQDKSLLETKANGDKTALEAS